jgi:c-di-GMP phosphodiesterase
VGPALPPSSQLPEKELLLDVFVARQPIFDANGTVVAYELLYRRSSAHTAADGLSSDVMASEVLVHTFLNMGIDRVTGGAKAFLNFTREMVVRGVHQLFDPSQVVIELLETVRPDDEVISAARGMVDAGFTLALDDFVYDPSFNPLLGLASIVKLDVLNRSESDLREAVARVAPFDVQILAERVETIEVHRNCTALGFVLFQGYFYCKPETLTRRDLSAAQLTILRLLNLLRDPRTTDAELEASFRGDLSLSYKLLRTVNSAAIGGRGIESIRHAVRLVGRKELHKWLSLLLLTSVAAGGGVGAELVRTAMQRARFCELIALQGRDKRTAEALFMVGLFSLLDAILRIPLAEIVERIDLSTEVQRALLLRSGPYAPTLLLAEAWEHGSWDVAVAEAGPLGIDGTLLGEMYLEALRWTEEKMGLVY